MTAYQRRSRLHQEIRLYLEFMDEARYEDPLWKEYRAWKRLTAMRAESLAQRLSRYTMR